jgi:hypothetical protein
MEQFFFGTPPEKEKVKQNNFYNSIYDSSRASIVEVTSISFYAVDHITRPS